MQKYLGHIFEIGFNIGILSYIKQHKIKHNFGELYQQDIEKLNFAKMVRQLIKEANSTSAHSRETIDKWALYFLHKGFLSGLNFFGEYVKSWVVRLEKLQIIYYQCSFVGANSLQTHPKSESQADRDILAQLLPPDQIDQLLSRRYHKKGEFLQADTLMLLEYNQKFRIFCVDLSAFTALSNDDLGEIEIMRKLLIKDLNYLQSKSVFANLRIDTSTLGVNLSAQLKDYLTAFKSSDKEDFKLIQAGSYAESFYNFILEKNIINQDTDLLFNVVGYTDRSLNTLTLRKENLGLLKTCADIYKHEIKSQDINQARQEVLHTIQLNARPCFQKGNNFIKSILAIKPEENSPIIHQETLKNFANSIDIISDDLAEKLELTPGLELRQSHAELIIKYLNSDATYLFLTGNPGIGKTTAIASFLQQHIDDGFLLFYASPRTQVNLDIIEKFKDQTTGLLCDDRLFCLYTNATVIKSNSGRGTVKYISNTKHEDFMEKTVNFLPEDRENKRQESYQQNITRKNDRTLQATRTKSRGVIDSISQGIYALINTKISNNIIATVCIQSLKKHEGRKDTMEHFKKIFDDAWNEIEGRVIPAKMQQISQRIKHIFIMIDEITGDDAGAEFLQGVSNMVNRYQLSQYFNTKVIVADASIVDQEAIEQHLNDSSPEPDKIYFKKLTTPAEILKVDEFQFKKKSAIAINANSFPARSLTMTYKVFVETIKLREEIDINQKNSLVKLVQTEIVKDINNLLEQPGVEQIIVYIQNKARLDELIERIKAQREFEQNEHYLEINANISDEQKKNIHKYKNNVQVIFMTSSASRGLSFPKTKHILVDIPKFQLEKNLMEVIQVIYRGRGSDSTGKTLDNEDKELVFYLSDQVKYSADSSPISLQESKLNLLNILLILKTSIMTRIMGYGDLGREQFLMIPIGGKSVSAVGETFTNGISHLLRDLESEHRRQPSDQKLKEVANSLHHLFNRAEFILSPATAERKNMISYLKLREDFTRNFTEICQNNLVSLLDYGNMEPGIIWGNLLLVPLADQNLEEKYQMRLCEQIRKYVTNDLRQKMDAIGNNRNLYPENLRSSIKGVKQLFEILDKEVDKSQTFEQQSKRFDRYYAIPLYTFINHQELEQYWKNEPAEPEDRKFRQILSNYAHSIFPISNVLPIGDKYQEFPFIVFRSYSLEEMREKMFTDKYLLTSNELNVLNLILSKKD